MNAGRDVCRVRVKDAACSEYAGQEAAVLNRVPRRYSARVPKEDFWLRFDDRREMWFSEDEIEQLGGAA